MKKISILIVEDEPIIAKDLSFILQDMGYSVAGIKHDGRDALAFLEQERVDLILLDINIEGDIDGVQVAEYVNEKFNLPFIFLTSYSDQDTIERVKKTQPVGYLVKPIDEKDLHTTIEIGLNNFVNGNHSMSLDKMNNPFEDILFIKDQNSLVKVEIKDIQFAEASDNYTLIYTDQKKYIISSTLKGIESRLSSWNFMRVHRSYVLNPEKISKIEANHVIIGKHRIPISRRLKEDFMSQINTL